MPYPVDTVTTTGAFLLVLALVVPVVSVLVAFVAGGRHAERIALATMPLGLAIAVAIAVMLRRTGGPLVYLLGGWAPPYVSATCKGGRISANGRPLRSMAKRRGTSTTRSQSIGCPTVISGSASTSRTSLTTSRRAVRSTKRPTSVRRRSIFPNAPSTCSRTSYRRAYAA